MRVELHGSGEFDAEGVTLRGSHAFSVPDGRRLTLRPDGAGGFSQQLELLRGGGPSWRWRYAADDEGAITLRREEAHR